MMFLVLVVLLIGLLALGYFFVRDGKWHEDADGRQMRRFFDGQWQYRPMTRKERDDALEHARRMDDDAREW